MKLSIFKVDAFTDHLFCGNSAAVLPLDQWLSDAVMQSIASENNLPITVFYVPTNKGFHIRWFTPTCESNLCGHGTLAAAFVISQFQNYTQNEIHFDSQNGELAVIVNDNWLSLNFPADSYKMALAPPALLEGFTGNTIAEIFKGGSDYMVVLGSEHEVVNLEFDIIVLSTIPARGIIVTAPGEDVDFVSRFFAPQSGIDEDPVTSSTHATLAPYWAGKLSKKVLTAKQLSKRGGYLKCELDAEFVKISGQAKLYLRGEIHID